MSMDERMTICNMSIEGGARAGYVNPDDTTFAYLKGRQYVPKGDAFDKAYIAHEVVYHQAVLDAMDKTLIPSAQNAELKALLVKVRPAFVAHLDHAKHLQAEYAK